MLDEITGGHNGIAVFEERIWVSRNAVLGY